ncbi:flavoprotein [Obelidium mucronatum]|nr:flavoprotein [Obelidium mucronatum]
MVNILIGCTGSVASLKIPSLVQTLKEIHPEAGIKVVATSHALHFFDKQELVGLNVPVLTEDDEWSVWNAKGDPVLHIELRNWADVLVVSPLDANTLGKIANGLCDNLLTCILRAWDVKKPVLLAPAMNTAMWNHPLTARHLETLLACGDLGIGAMAEVQDIVNSISKLFKN